MARRPRLQFAGAIYHVMARGNRKSTIFHDDHDRRQFLRVVAEAATAYDLRIMALCLMGNHYHILLETPDRNLSEAMQFINGVYAQRSNRRYAQTGHVFEARFRSLVIQRESYLRRAARYVVRNPVRAKWVPEAAAWAWSSYRATAGLKRPPGWLNVDWIRWAFKTDSLPEAKRRYAGYVNAPASSQRRIALNAVVLGTRRFGEHVLKAYGEGQPEVPVPQHVRTLVRPTLAELFESAERSSEARDRFIHSARADYRYRFVEIARYLKIDRSTASKAARRARRHEFDTEL
jgi:REP-associated tyrosine transposase